MASFKASHPKRHDLTLARTGGERRSLDVRAHLKGPWRRVVKKLTFRLVPVRSGSEEEDDEDDDDEDDEDDDARIGKIRVCGNSRMKRSRYVGALWAYV